MRKMTQATKDLRARNRKRYYRLHIEAMIKADKCGASGMYEACTEYRTESLKHYKSYLLNGGK